MAEALKNFYNRESLSPIADDIARVYPSFDAEGFLEAVLSDPWDDLELKARSRRISESLREFLPADYPSAIAVIDQVVMNDGTWLDGFGFFFPTFVELFGVSEEYWEVSVGALERYTPYASSEFAVRPFIVLDQERMMAQMLAWAGHEDEHVRRLASEGCRPQLPWAPALAAFKKDPSPIVPILERLKADPSPHVRTSVGNNLNDISKTHPELVLEIAQQWHGADERTDWIVKHGCRTLLKRGNRLALGLFGWVAVDCVEVRDLGVEPPRVPLGGVAVFSFIVEAKVTAKVRLEYAVDYVKFNGIRHRKQFKIAELSLAAGHKRYYERRLSFVDISTRKHYPGIHTITLVVNGIENQSVNLELIEYCSTPRYVTLFPDNRKPIAPPAPDTVSEQ
ncbi:MAG: DNA alkylation repair protein [Propionibacteriaceae bacterium]|nr:DNA alkylation repair protein [Propionibacteriaceae bacterium]